MCPAGNQSFERIELRAQIAAYPQTLWAFVGASGRSVKFVVPYTRPDGTLPQTETEAALFHAHAFRHAIKTYEPRLSYPIELKEPHLTQSCRLSYDPETYYNSQALAIHLEQPTQMRRVSENLGMRSNVTFLFSLSSLWGVR